MVKWRRWVFHYISLVQVLLYSAITISVKALAMFISNVWLRTFHFNLRTEKSVKCNRFKQFSYLKLPRWSDFLIGVISMHIEDLININFYFSKSFISLKCMCLHFNFENRWKIKKKKYKKSIFYEIFIYFSFFSE